MSLLGTLAVVVGTLLVHQPARAYSPGEPSVTVGRHATLESGVHIRVTRLQPGSTLILTWGDDEAMTVKVGSDGVATAILPVSEAGRDAVTLSGTDASGGEWSDPVAVLVAEVADVADVANAAGTDGVAAQLAATRTDSHLPLAQVGLAALGIGALAVYASRRRSSI